MVIRMHCACNTEWNCRRNELSMSGPRARRAQDCFSEASRNRPRRRAVDFLWRNAGCNLTRSLRDQSVHCAAPVWRCCRWSLRFSKRFDVYTDPICASATWPDALIPQLVNMHGRHLLSKIVANFFDMPFTRSIGIRGATVNISIIPNLSRPDSPSLRRSRRQLRQHSIFASCWKKT
jgi:hypothetical protein